MSQKEAVFMSGLPGSGKSSYINKYYKNERYYIVSADDIRLNHPKYNPEHPEDIHEECVSLAEEKMYVYGNQGVNVVMDGGGINNTYTLRIMKQFKEWGYMVKLVYIDTPAQICIQRNNQRVKNNERFVPIDSIIDKSYKLLKTIPKLKEICDIYIRIPYFTNKYIFVDMDGTIAEYQNLPVDQNGDIDFVGYDVFKYSKPVIPVIETLKRLENNGSEIVVVSASPNSICNLNKEEWLKKYTSFIKTYYFVGNRNFKHTFLKHLMLRQGINPQDCTVVDDDHAILKLYETIGVNAIHPSKLLTSY